MYMRPVAIPKFDLFRFILSSYSLRTKILKSSEEMATEEYECRILLLQLTVECAIRLLLKIRAGEFGGDSSEQASEHVTRAKTAQYTRSQRLHVPQLRVSRVKQ
jgi:hypothetical protein